MSVIPTARSGLIRDDASMPVLALLRTALLTPIAWVIVGLLSWRQWFLTLGAASVICHEAPYRGQPVLLLALYEKGNLRPDILRLLQAARERGFYVLAVNTLRLAAPGVLRDLVGCYIERPNYGRDFGSYRTGFLHLYARGWEQCCPRLLMLNDSVFFASRGLDAFLETMRDSPAEVLGATENHEIAHHLGSFCIAMAQRVLSAPRLIRFWKGYRLSDIRPVVIRHGEMGLSKVLAQCVSSPAQMRALHGAARFLEELRDHSALQDAVLGNRRRARHTPAPRLGLGSIAAQIPCHGGAHEAGIASAGDTEEIITTRDRLRDHLLRHGAPVPPDLDLLLSRAITAAATENFMRGSQIHQNALILVELGLPLVKLDLLYRGMFDIHDLLQIMDKFSRSEAGELAGLLMARPFGGQTHIGWKRAAFMRGLI